MSVITPLQSERPQGAFNARAVREALVTTQPGYRHAPRCRGFFMPVGFQTPTFYTHTRVCVMRVVVFSKFRGGVGKTVIRVIRVLAN